MKNNKPKEVESYVVVYSKTRKGKPHPTGGVYKFCIPLSKFKG